MARRRNGALIPLRIVIQAQRRIGIQIDLLIVAKIDRIGEVLQQPPNVSG